MATSPIKAIIGRQTVSRTPSYPSTRRYEQSAIASAKAVTNKLLAVLEAFKGPQSVDVMIYALTPTLELAKSYTPVQTGDLVASGYLEATQFRGHPRVEIGFGYGGKPDYTIYVHEMVDMPHPNGGQAKFLQAAVLEDLGEIYNRLGQGYAGWFYGR